MMFETDNEVLTKAYRKLPAIECVQKKGEKCIVDSKAIHKATRIVLGKNDIGSITNRITAITSLMSSYDKDSVEYKTLLYRTQAGQAYQQDSIDAIKGIKTTPMPKEWYDKSACKFKEEDTTEDMDRKEFNASICVNKKPYFFMYNYPQLKREYQKCIKNAEMKAYLTFHKNYETLVNSPLDTLNEEELKFLDDVERQIPVFDAPCTMNRICKYVERDISRFFEAYPTFDYTCLLSNESIFSHRKELAVQTKFKKLITKFQRIISNLTAHNAESDLLALHNHFKYELTKFGDYNSVLDAFVKYVYESHTGMYLLWSLLGDELIQRMIKQYKTISYPVISEDGTDVMYQGHSFKINREVINNDNNE